MTMSDVVAGGAGFDPESRKRWGRGLVVALGLHVALLVLLTNWAAHRAVPEAPPVAIMIDMMPTPSVPAQQKVVEPNVISPAKSNVQREQLPVMEKPEVVLQKSRTEPKPVRSEPPMSKARRAPSASSVEPAAPALAVSPVEAKPTVSPNYLGVLFEHLERYKRYPRVFGARRGDFVVLVHVELDRRGKVLSLAIEKSSGSKTYDNAALSTFRRADPLPPFPSSMTQARLSLDVPVRFTLSD